MNTPDPGYRKVQRTFVALCILLTPLLLAGWFALCPQYGDPSCPTNQHPEAVFAAFRAADPSLLHIFLVLNLLIPYLYPISYVGLGLVSMRRSPWWSTAGIAFGWLGSIAWGFISDGIFTLYTAIRIGQDASFAVFEKAYFSDPRITMVAIGWVIGHWGGYLLLGIALWRSRKIPRWAAALIIISGPLMGPIAYGVNDGWLQVLGFVTVFIGSLSAARALLREQDEGHALLQNQVKRPGAGQTTEAGKG
jgi:hypothetical protein